ncbi:snoRNA-binding rRNA-processing protein utp10 [Cladophialophora chaetospira]|uniref:U3 small nucleolar RNA-associated protein 10 n=1 Tax=Cladophialophora chaetospira TaxID=386627 RepID=A0AA38X2S8_9EURO|nr:snoRNA-binding rRNA-processing protein utp10 [Cladophialophora chaetospira]
MTSTFAAQLRSIAANSTNELDLRARRDAHGESLIFERSVAVKQGWETIYQICLEGFQELCLLDSRLREFEQNLYSPHAKDQDREQLSKSQNEALGLVLERCLALLGSKVLLRPGVKAVEWLVRRFRVHIYNTAALLATFLPYHETTVFRNVLSIVPPNKIVSEWKFLGPYHKDAANVPRHAVVYSATHNDAFFSYFNNYTLRACQEGAGHPQLLRFWGSITAEAITGRLQQVKSGRKEVQRQRTEDALLKILPVLNEGYEVRDCLEMTIACFTIALVLAGNADLEDHVIDALLKATAPFVVNGEADARSALACVAILITKKEDKRLPKDVLDIFTQAVDLSADFAELHRQVPLTSLCEALLSSALSALKQKNIEARTRFAERLFDIARGLFDPATKSRLVAIVLQKLRPKVDRKPAAPALQAPIVRLLQTLNDSPDFSSSFASAASSAGLPLPEVEGLLEGVVQSPPQIADPNAMDVDVVDNAPAMLSDAMTSEAIDKMLASLPTQSTELSFLVSRHSSLFDQLAQAFTLCQKEGLLARLKDLPMWRQKTENPADLYTSFLLRIALSASSVSDRHDALQLLYGSLELGAKEHTQLLIPYLTVLLSDPASAVRTAAAMCIVEIQKCLLGEDTAGEHHNAEKIYDALSLTNVKRVPAAQALKLVQIVYQPYLEECILDTSHIHKILHAAFDGQERTSLPAKTDVGLKKTQKQMLFELLTSCALSCPLLKIKVGLIDLLVGIGKVGNSTTSKTLSPLLKDWAHMSEADAEAIASIEGLKISRIDAVMIQLLTAQDKQIVEEVLTMLVDGTLQPRHALATAFFDRIVAIWKDIRQEGHVAIAVRLFDMSFSDVPAQAAGSRGVLHAVTLSTEVLAAILDHSLSDLAQMQIEGPPKKRRRTSQGRESIPQDNTAGIHVNEAPLTFALELTENAKAENHPELLAGLFEVLVVLRRLKTKNTSESPYLLHLCLGSILAIVDKAKMSRKPNIDMTIIRADLVTDCVRSSENPQVQSTALLLSASLASIAPDRILHTIMPIFTFMGNSILSKEDDRSIYVTNRAIDVIIPPLVASLKKQDAKNLIHSTISLLSSFVTAYDHVPQHRRVAFYQRLLTRLGAEDFSFAIIALLASRRRSEDMSTFFTSLIGDFSASTQLLTFRKLIDLSIDVFGQTPHNAEPLLDITKKTPTAKKEEEALLLLEVTAKQLGPRSLKGRVKRLSKADEAERDLFWTEFKTCISRLLGMLKAQKTQHSSLSPATKKCLSALLELLSLADLLAIVPNLLTELAQVEETRELQPLALRVLALQLQQHASKDGVTQTEAIAFLPTLDGIIKTTEDQSFRYAAIQCLDRIVELYGRKNPDAVVSAASTLIEDANYGLGSSDEKTQIMSLLCLATAMEVLKEGGVPIVLGAMPKLLRLLLSSIMAGSPEFHNACYTLLSSFVTHVPFMVSDENIVQILETSYTSCESMPDASCKEARLDTLRLMAQKFELDSLTTSLDQALEASVARLLVSSPIIEFMDVLSLAIEHNSKATVANSAEQISNLILQGFSLGRDALMELQVGRPADPGLEGIQDKLNALGIAFIYKLNDTKFRPIFESWVERAVKGSSGDDDETKLFRLWTFFSFAEHFFGTLKSIVTSYASYILPAINDVLRSAIKESNPDESEVSLSLSVFEENHSTFYKLTLSLFGTIASSDSDGFFTTPSHFQPLANLLVKQYNLLSSRAKDSQHRRQEIMEVVLAALVSLATAVQDVPAHHHTLNHLLCQLRHSDSAQVRLASIASHITLTESEVGDEWVQNVVLGSASTTEEGVSVGGSGETMIYVNEMLEDDDEDVEREVRRWVNLVRERVGEDVFEV